jgi:hypothetical protein
MAKLYQVNVLASVSDEGLGSYVLTGESKIIDGQTFIDLGSMYVANDGSWFETVAEARRASAKKIEDIGSKILAQAERFRQG